MRQRKPANIQGELELYASVIVSDPTSLKGCWRSTLMPSAREIRLDLGCGKGGFLIQMALAHPDILFIGLDYNEVCVARTAAKLYDEGVKNALVGILDADNLSDAFAPEELDRIYLNFNSPFPAKKYAWKRLSHLDRLMEYRHLLAPQGMVDLRTDHDPYWQFTLLQFDLAGYQIVRKTDDLHNQPDGFDVFESEYDQKTVSRGAVVHALQAYPGPEPAEKPEQTAPLSLIDYLPEDLSTLTRIPYGMEGTIENLRNRAANAAARRNRQR